MNRSKVDPVKLKQRWKFKTRLNFQARVRTASTIMQSKCRIVWVPGESRIEAKDAAHKLWNARHSWNP